MVGVLQRRKKKTPIGIDMGAGGTRAVQLVREGDGYRILHVARTEGHGIDGDERHVRAAQQLTACMRQAVFKGTSAVMALNAPDAEFHALELPKATHSELEQIVRLEVERLMTISGGETEVRYWTLPEGNAAAPNAIGVVAPREVILNVLKVCREAKLTCSAMRPGATALCHVGCLLARHSSEVIWGVLDLGLTQTRLVVCIDDVPVLVRSVGRGGDGWTKRLAEALQTSHKTAEVQKRSHGIAPPARDGAAGFSPRGVPNADGVAGLRGTAQAEACGSGIPTVILGKLRSDLNELASEVKRSYEYVLSCYPSRHAGSLIMVGGGAALGNLPEFLSDSLGITVHRASDYLNEPCCRLTHGSTGQAPLEPIAQAVGLAVEG